MNSAWKLGSPFGIGVYVHWTFLLLLGLVLLEGYGMIGVLFVSAIFGCVTLHEYGHALMARRYGIGTRRITLYPIGGVAQLMAMPREPRQELAVALAGPAVNVLLAPLAYFAGVALAMMGFAGAAVFFGVLAKANLILAAFNLLPAFPMDGGRVLRAWLARKRDYVSATHIAARIGQAFAVFFAIFALFNGPITLLILAAFVFFAAAVERRQAILQAQQGAWMFGSPWRQPSATGATPGAAPPSRSSASRPGEFQEIEVEVMPPAR